MILVQSGHGPEYTIEQCVFFSTTFQKPNSPSAASAVISLGAGSRSPAGIEPYVAFVRDAVFLKFNTRYREHYILC